MTRYSVDKFPAIKRNINAFLFNRDGNFKWVNNIMSKYVVERIKLIKQDYYTHLITEEVYRYNLN